MLVVKKYILLMVMCLVVHGAMADCDVDFVDIHEIAWQGNSKGIGYNIFDDDTAAQEVRFELLRTSGTEQCQIAIDIDATGSGSTGSQGERYLQNSMTIAGLAPQQHQLRYNLFLDEHASRSWLPYSPERGTENMILVTFSPRLDIIDNTGDTTSNLTTPVAADATIDEIDTEKLTNAALRQSNLAPVDKKEFFFYYAINAGQLVGAGKYAQDLIMTAYEISDAGFIPKVMHKVKVTAKVKELVNVGISKDNIYTATSSKKHIMNFGALDYGKTVSDNVNLLIRTNANVKYSVESENKGVLTLETGFDPKLGLAHKFPYVLKIDGQEHLLTTNKSYNLNLSEHGIDKSGTAVPLEVTIDGNLDLENYHPGSYKDTVLISVDTDG